MREIKEYKEEKNGWINGHDEEPWLKNFLTLELYAKHYKLIETIMENNIIILILT